MSLIFEDCRFSYRRGRPVLLDLDLEFAAGSTILLGPNGAGKSTLLALGASVLRPDLGRIRYGQWDAARRRNRAQYRRRVSWMPQRVRAVPGFTTREQVAYAGWLKGMPRIAAWGAARQALLDVGLGELTERKSTELSGGQLRRVAFAQALVHDAEVILLDEPTAGLDPNQYQRFLRVVGALQDRVQIVVSTHQIDDVADIYESVVLLDRGRCTFAGPVATFLETVSGRPGASLSAGFAHLVEEEED